MDIGMVQSIWGIWIIGIIRNTAVQERCKTQNSCVYDVLPKNISLMKELSTTIIKGTSFMRNTCEKVTRFQDSVKVYNKM